MKTDEVDLVIRKLREKQLGTEVIRQPWELRNAPRQSASVESRLLPSAKDRQIEVQNVLLRVEIRSLKASLAPAPGPLSKFDALMARLQSLEARLEDKVRAADARKPSRAENPLGDKNTKELLERQRKASVEALRKSLLQ